ncbi:hypothetical protein D4764_01G0016740 [Takifugu flavidus]|uniref:Uncharacterized protein n=1 Tax=Takifugu flavidus TaxID=433684 RepID=A0A5C6PSJ7_9TELE|nr:hypothetical protein D4764_01G0016740 [Takifugu flavidus]
MDPAHSPSPLARLERIEVVLQQHETMMATAAPEVRQAAQTHEHTLAGLPHTFAREEAKVVFVINHLNGRTQLWGTAGTCASFDQFAAELCKTRLLLPKGPQTVATLIDSGSDVTINGEVAHQFELGWELLPQPVPARAWMDMS